jgi:LCP family protein required for cell wall assembly
MATRRPNRGPVWAKITIAMGLALVFASAGLAGKGSGLTGSKISGAIDILLLGVEDTHADTIIVLHVPASRDEAYLISLERDLLVQLPPWPASGYLGGQAKLADTFFHGGAKFVAQTVSRTTGLRFDGLAVIDLQGFRNLLDALGPVRMCIDQETYSHRVVFVDGDPQGSGTRTRGHKERILFRKGCQDLPGWAALDYSRQRHQMTRLLKAIAHKATSAGVITDPARVRRLLEAAGRTFILETSGRPLDDFLLSLKQIAAADLVRVKGNEPSQQMFDAVARDDLGGFLLEHPQFLVAS